MSQANQFWQAVSLKESQLRQEARATRDQQHSPYDRNGDFVHIVSRESMALPGSKSDVISQVSLRQAAKSLLEGLAEIASPARMERHIADERAKLESYRAIERKARNQFLVGIDPTRGPAGLPSTSGKEIRR